MKLTRNERGAVIKGFAQQCRRAGKKRKGRILDQAVEATWYNRRNAARVLRAVGWGLLKPLSTLSQSVDAGLNALPTEAAELKLQLPPAARRFFSQISTFVRYLYK